MKNLIFLFFESVTFFYAVNCMNLPRSSDLNSGYPLKFAKTDNYVGKREEGKGKPLKTMFEACSNRNIDDDFDDPNIFRKPLISSLVSMILFSEESSECDENSGPFLDSPPILLEERISEQVDLLQNDGETNHFRPSKYEEESSYTQGKVPINKYPTPAPSLPSSSYSSHASTAAMFQGSFGIFETYPAPVKITPKPTRKDANYPDHCDKPEIVDNAYREKSSPLAAFAYGLGYHSSSRKRETAYFVKKLNRVSDFMYHKMGLDDNNGYTCNRSYQHQSTFVIREFDAIEALNALNRICPVRCTLFRKEMEATIGYEGEPLRVADFLVAVDIYTSSKMAVIFDSMKKLGSDLNRYLTHLNSFHNSVIFRDLLEEYKSSIYCNTLDELVKLGDVWLRKGLFIDIDETTLREFVASLAPDEEDDKVKGESSFLAKVKIQLERVIEKQTYTINLLHDTLYGLSTDGLNGFGIWNPALQSSKLLKDAGLKLKKNAFFVAKTRLLYLLWEMQKYKLLKAYFEQEMKWKTKEFKFSPFTMQKLDLLFFPFSRISQSRRGRESTTAVKDGFMAYLDSLPSFALFLEMTLDLEEVSEYVSFVHLLFPDVVFGFEASKQDNQVFMLERYFQPQPSISSPEIKVSLLKALELEIKRTQDTRPSVLHGDFYRHCHNIYENAQTLYTHIRPLYLHIARNFGGTRMEQFLDLETVLRGWRKGLVEEAYFNKLILTLRDKLLNRIQIDRLLDFGV